MSGNVPQHKRPSKSTPKNVAGPNGKNAKRRRILTAEMPGPCMPINFENTANHDFASDSEIRQHLVASGKENSISVFVTPTFVPVEPARSVGKMIDCKLRNASGRISFATFKVYFSDRKRPLVLSDDSEVIKYDDEGAVVYYADYNLPRTIEPHAHYIGHIVNHSTSKSSPQTETERRSCWVRLVCAHCKIDDKDVIVDSLVDMRHTGNNEKFGRHMYKYHKDIPMEVSYQTIAARLHAQDFKELLSSLMRLVVYERLPFSFLASKSFVAFCRLLNPAIVVPSPNQFVTHLEMYIRSHVQNFTSPSPILGFPDNPNKHVLGGTVLMDAWESHAGNHLLCIQYQYCDHLYQKRARFLALKEIVGPADAVTVSEIANSALSTHGLDKTFYFTMSDSGSNIVCAFKHVTKRRWFPMAVEPIADLESSFDSNTFQLLDAPELDAEQVAPYITSASTCGSTKLHCQFRCNAHLCNLIVGSAINDKVHSGDVKSWFTDVMANLTFIRRRHYLQDSLRAIIGRGARPYIEVRWNTVHDALDILTTVEGFTAVQKIIRQVYDDPSSSTADKLKFPRQLDGEDFILVQEMYRILNCLARPCDILQSDYASAPDVLTQFALAYKSLTCIIPTKRMMTKFRETIMRQFRIRVKPLFQCNTLIAATFIQPSQKRVFRWMHAALPDNPFGAPTTAEAREILESLCDAMPSSQDSDADDFLSFEPASSNSSTVDKYFAEDVQKQSFASFWLYKQKHYPELAKLARIFDGLPASTGKVERSFSLLGLNQGDRRVNLSVDRLEQMIMFTQADRGSDEVVPAKVITADKDSNFNAHHSCCYVQLIKNGVYSYPPLYRLPE